MTLLLFCEMILARDSLSAWTRNNPTSELSPINSRVLCGPRPKAAAVTSVHPQPLDVLLSQAHLPGHLMPGLLPAHRGSAFEVGSLHFQGRMSKMQTHGQLCCGGQTSVAGSAPGLQLSSTNTSLVT